ncbi:tetratricopeptide repeat protein [Candidatus Latescibacterota bacterium]
MNIGYVFLIIVASAAYFVTNIPTPDQMIADFNAAQRFYTSAAYDQAIEGYTEVGDVDSRFVDEDNVIVTIGTMALRVKDATLYQTGNSYNKMAALELDLSRQAELAAEREQHQVLAEEYIERGTDFYNQVQEVSYNDELKIMAQKMIIDTWYLVNDHERVIEEGGRLIELYPNSVYVQDALYNIGWAHYDSERYDQAIDSFNELITRFPTGNRADRALFQIGEAYFAQGEYDQAIPNFQSLVDKMRINELTPLEIQKIQRDKLAGLTDDTALDLAARAALRIGACYGNQGRYDEAEASYKRMASLFTFDNNLIFAAYTSLADMYFDQGLFDDSIQAYRDAIDEVADRILNARMQNLIGQRYLNGYTDTDGVVHTYYQEAIQEYQNYIVNYSDVAYRAGFDVDRAFFSLGQAYNQLGNQLVNNGEEVGGNQNIQQAIDTYLRIFEDIPGTPIRERVYFYLASAYQDLGTDESLNSSIEWYNTLLTEYVETPYKEYVYVKLGRAYRSLEDYDTAVKYYTTMIDEFPDSEAVDAVWFEIGVTMNDSGDNLGAVQYLLNVSRNNPTLFTTARLLGAQTILQAGRNEQVIEVLDYALEDTSAIESLYRLSQLYLMRGNAHRALEHIDEALRDYTAAYDQNQPETMQMASVYRAGIYIDQEQYARAETDLKELMQSDDEDIRRMSQIRLAIISVRQDKSEQAIQTYLDLYNGTEDVSEKLSYLRNLIQLSSTSQNWEELTRFANMMIESDLAEDQMPEGQTFYYKEEAWYMLGDAAETQSVNLEEAGQLVEASQMYLETVDLYQKGYSAFPNSFYSSDMLLKLGVIYLTKLLSLPDALDIAAEYFDEYIKQFADTPNAEMAHYYLGFCYYNGRRFTESNATFRSFAQRFPNSEFTPEAIFYYSEGGYNQGNLQSAIQGLDLMLSRYPNHDKASEALYTKAWCYLDLEDEENAIQTFQVLVDRFPGSEFSPTALYSIADYFYNAQNYEDAIENYQAVLDNYPESDVATRVPETLDDLTETVAYLAYEEAINIFSQAQDTNDLNLFRQAAEIFQRIVEQYPDTESEIGAWSNMGICYEALSRWQDAISAYDQVINKFEEGADVSQDAFTFARMHRDYIVANRM